MLHGVYTENSIRIPELKVENHHLREQLAQQKAETKSLREEKSILISRNEELERTLDNPALVHKACASAVRDFLGEAMEAFPEQAASLKELSREFIRDVFHQAPPSPSLLNQGNVPEEGEEFDIVDEAGTESLEGVEGS